MRKVEQYFRSYFEDEADLTAFYLSYSVTVVEEMKHCWILEVMDHAGNSYQGSDYPHCIIFREDKRVRDFAKIFFSIDGHSIIIDVNHGLPTKPLWVVNERPKLNTENS